MKAYTLIELLVTVTIVILITGTSMAAYLTFNENRQLDIDARNLSTLLNKIRSKATFLEYPSGCTGLVNFQADSSLDVSNRSTVISYFANCASGATEVVSETVLTSSVFADPVQIIFLPTTGNLQSTEDVDINLQSTKGSSRTKKVTINKFFGTSNVINNEE